MEFLTDNLDIIGTVLIGVLVLFGLKVRAQAIIGDIGTSLYLFGLAFNIWRNAMSDDMITPEEALEFQVAMVNAWNSVTNIIIAAKSFRRV